MTIFDINVETEGKQCWLPNHEIFSEHLISLCELKRERERAWGVWGKDVYMKESVVFHAECEIQGQREWWMGFLGKWESWKLMTLITCVLWIFFFFVCLFFKEPKLKELMNYFIRWRYQMNVCYTAWWKTSGLRDSQQKSPAYALDCQTETNTDTQSRQTGS